MHLTSIEMHFSQRHGHVALALCVLEKAKEEEKERKTQVECALCKGFPKWSGGSLCAKRTPRLPEERSGVPFVQRLRKRKRERPKWSALCAKASYIS